MKNQTNQKPEFTTEVNQLVNALCEANDFTMSYEDGENNINTDLIDDDKDLAQITLNGHIVCTYVYGGPYMWPTFVDEMLLDEALTVASEFVK